MDFIARTGNMMNKTHRMVGIMIILVVVQAFWINSLYNRIADLSKKYTYIYSDFDRIKDDLKVYVVPGSAAGIYAPEKTEILLSHFVDHITQSLLTYTDVNIANQYNEIRNFFSSNMLVHFDKGLDQRIDSARTLGRSSMFIPDRKTLKVEEVKDSKAVGKVAQKKVTLEGTVHTILGGGSIQEDRFQISMTLNAVNVSKSNPFGYMVHKYSEKRIPSLKR